jgi:UDP-N-acetylmuramoylalanine--D-glutamate ligase
VRAQRAGDTAVLNADDPYAPRFAQDAGGRVLYFSLASLPSDGAVLEGDMLCLRRGGYTLPVCTRRDLRVPGLHNVANALAAMAAAEVIGVEPEAMLQAVADFTGVPHRLELVRILDGVRYLNDSIATSPDRAGAALAAVEEPILLILGGHDKDLPWAAFSRSAVARCRGIFLIGEAQELIAEHLERAMNEAGDSLLRPSGLRRCGDLPQAVAQASEVARPGDVVLLSPACASYDQFQSFEARGARFRELVEALRGRS